LIFFVRCTGDKPTISEFLKALCRTDDEMETERAKISANTWSLLLGQVSSYTKTQAGNVGVTFMEQPGKGKTHTVESVDGLLRDWTGEKGGFRFQGAIKAAIKDKVINEIQLGLCAGCGKVAPFQDLDHKNMSPR